MTHQTGSSTWWLGNCLIHINSTLFWKNHKKLEPSLKLENILTDRRFYIRKHLPSGVSSTSMGWRMVTRNNPQEGHTFTLTAKLTLETFIKSIHHRSNMIPNKILNRCLLVTCKVSPSQEHTLQWGKEARGQQPGDVTSVASCRGRVMAYDTLQVTRVLRARDTCIEST